MNRAVIRGTVLLSAAALTCVLAGCGNNNPTKSDSQSQKSEATSLSGTLAGAGASSQKAAIAAWKAGFSSKNPNASVEYDPVGSGSGVKKFLAKEVSFAGSDEYVKGKDFTAAQERCGGSVMNIPVYISPIAVVFNLSGIETLNLDAPTVAKIFSGKITQWNDPEIAQHNEGVKLPNKKITVVHRADDSGTTYNFTEWMHKAAPNVWTSDASKKWPFEGTNGQKTQGVVQLVKDGEGSIGYVDDSAASGLGKAAIRGSGDKYVKVSAQAAAATLDESQLAGSSDTDLAYEINRTPKNPDAYPVILVSYDVVCGTYPQKSEADLVKAFVTYETSAEGQKSAQDAAHSAPISDTLRSKIAQALEQIKVGK